MFPDETNTAFVSDIEYIVVIRIEVAFRKARLDLNTTINKFKFRTINSEGV